MISTSASHKLQLRSERLEDTAELSLMQDGFGIRYAEYSCGEIFRFTFSFQSGRIF